MSRRLVTMSLVLLFVLGALFVAANYVVENYLQNKIISITGLTAAEIKCSMFSNSYEISDIIVDSSSTLPIIGTCRSIQIKGLNRLKYFLNGDIILKDLVVEDLDIRVHEEKIANLSLPASPGFENPIIVHDVVVRNANIHYYKDNVRLAAIDEIHGRLMGFELNSVDSITYKDLSIHTGPVTISPSDGFHRMEVRATSYDPSDGLLKLEGCHYYTPIAKKNWYTSVKEKQTRLDWKAEDVLISQPDLVAFINHGALKADKIVITKTNLEAFEDQRFDHCDTCMKELPHVTLRKMEKRVNIDSVLIKQGDITYMSKEVGRMEWGEARFSSVYGALYGLTNIKSELKKHPKMLLDIQASLFDRAPMKIHFEFDMLSEAGDYTYQGMAKDFSLLRLNDYLARAKQVKVNTGTCEGINFMVEANNTLSHGLINFPYRNLKVAFLKEDKSKNKLLSKLLNGFVVHRDNIKSGNYRQGIIYHEVDVSRSIFYSLSQSLQAGIQSSTLKSYVLPEELKN